MEITSQIAKELNVKEIQIERVLELLAEGSTVPFIARYRKELTGGLDETQIQTINKEYEYRVALQKRKEDVIRLIDEKGMLTEEIKTSVINAEKLVDVEDIYRPYKEKKKTRAITAKNKGLEPLANYLLSFPLDGNIEDEAQKYLTEEVLTIDDALLGARDIIAEVVSDDAKYRKFVRETMHLQGVVEVKVKDEKADEKQVFLQYYEYSERVITIPSHRILAINRGESLKILKVSIVEPVEKIIEYLTEEVITNSDAITKNQVLMAIEDGYKRLIRPSVEREIRSELKDKAENQAIHVFGENAKRLLLQPPMKQKVVLGLDPAYRTGCKLAVVDVTGKVLAIEVIYPFENKKELSMKIMQNLIAKHDVDLIAIGNGTASRESEAFVVELLNTIDKDVKYAIVNEAGASVYSASKVAIEEFPDLTVEKRSAVSIARRLQDPLAELVKIDPKAIGVGQYQHDVNQSKLSDSLSFVVETAVNSVGVNVNTASAPLLQYVSGLTSTAAKNIVKYRDANGSFLNREQLKKIPRIGSKSYEQAIGFLRIIDGDNPLDQTAIHPESYEIAKQILAIFGMHITSIGTNELKEMVNNCNREVLVKELNTDRYTLDDILAAFIAPTRDLRDEYAQPLLKSNILSLEDITEGIELEGVVRNIVDFGVFVDVGLKNDGLVHISKMAKHKVKHPLDIVNIGDVIKVYVESIDIDRQRLSLTMVKDKYVKNK